MQTILSNFTARLKAIFGGGLVSVILYGSAARGTYRKGISDINILILLEKSCSGKILELSRAAKSVMRKHRVTPLIMTREEFTSSADVFPLEYGDILDARQILYGDESVLNLNISRANLRYQLEEKLRGAVNDIRWMLLVSGGSGKRLTKFLLGWSGLSGTLFRGLLRLKGIRDIPADAAALLELVSAEYGVSTEDFAALERCRQGDKSAAVEVDSLLDTLTALTRIVDTMPGASL